MRKIQRFIDAIALRGAVYFKDDTGKEIVGVVIEHLKDNNFLIKSKEGSLYNRHLNDIFYKWEVGLK